MNDFPIPPDALIRRAGAPPREDLAAQYLAAGLPNKQHLLALHPAHEDFAGRRVLDFGCGAGKIMRHFASEALEGEVWGCDIDPASITWLEQNLSPPFHVFALGERPHLPQPDDYFDLTYAISVFTHVVQDWAGWLLEIHRTLKPDGIAVITFLGEGMIEVEQGGRWREGEIGMNVLRMGQDWAGGGPTVFHSDWWLRTHWGRAFEIEDIHHDREAGGRVVSGSHGYVVLRKLPVTLAPADLEAPEPGEEREIAALRRNIAQLHDDDARLRQLLLAAAARGDAEHTNRVKLEAEVARLSAQLAVSNGRYAQLAAGARRRLQTPLRRARARFR